MQSVSPRETDKAKVIKVAQTEAIIGIGTQKEPIRKIYQ